jgi:outer membrane protein OmpA-like peptidoglycan-associated protein
MLVFKPSLVIGLALLATAAGGCQSAREMGGRLVRGPAVCTDRTVRIYFEAESADLIPEGRAVLTQAAKEARRCRVNGVEVVGLADATGAADANYQLSQKRAATVAGVLAESRLPAPQFVVSAVGQEGATTSDGELRPVRRRADIVLHLAPR